MVPNLGIAARGRRASPPQTPPGALSPCLRAMLKWVLGLRMALSDFPPLRRFTCTSMAAEPRKGRIPEFPIHTCRACGGDWFREGDYYEFLKEEGLGITPTWPVLIGQLSPGPLTVGICLCGTPWMPSTSIRSRSLKIKYNTCCSNWARRHFSRDRRSASQGVHLVYARRHALQCHVHHRAMARSG